MILIMSWVRRYLVPPNESSWWLVGGMTPKLNLSAQANLALPRATYLNQARFVYAQPARPKQLHYFRQMLTKR